MLSLHIHIAVIVVIDRQGEFPGRELAQLDWAPADVPIVAAFAEEL